jgi:hypothetical protein
MNAFLARFTATLANDEHAVPVPDRAGWHAAKGLAVPSNVTLVWLPPYSPQLNPVERVWLYLREKHLSHRLLDTRDAVVDALWIGSPHAAGGSSMGRASTSVVVLGLVLSASGVSWWDRVTGGTAAGTAAGVSKTWGRPLACPGLIDLADA